MLPPAIRGNWAHHSLTMFQEAMGRGLLRKRMYMVKSFFSFCAVSRVPEFWIMFFKQTEGLRFRDMLQFSGQCHGYVMLTPKIP